MQQSLHYDVTTHCCETLVQVRLLPWWTSGKWSFSNATVVLGDWWGI